MKSMALFEVVIKRPPFFMHGFENMELEKKQTQFEQKMTEVLVHLLQQHHLSLYDLEYLSSSRTLRVYIINPETKTATLEECILVDKALDPIFENEDWIPEGVTLEVSSPGIFRELRKWEHLLMTRGERVKVKLSQKLMDASFRSEWKKYLKSNAITGYLMKIDEELQVIEIKLDESKHLNLRIDEIGKINCEPVL